MLYSFLTCALRGTVHSNEYSNDIKSLATSTLNNHSTLNIIHSSYKNISYSIIVTILLPFSLQRNKNMTQWVSLFKK